MNRSLRASLVMGIVLGFGALAIGCAGEPSGTGDEETSASDAAEINTLKPGHFGMCKLRRDPADPESVSAGKVVGRAWARYENSNPSFSFRFSTHDTFEARIFHWRPDGKPGVSHLVSLHIAKKLPGGGRTTTRYNIPSAEHYPDVTPRHGDEYEIDVLDRKGVSCLFRMRF